MKSPSIKLNLIKEVCKKNGSTYALYSLQANKTQVGLILISNGAQTQMELIRDADAAGELFESACSLSLSPEHLCDVAEDVRHSKCKIFD